MNVETGMELLAWEYSPDFWRAYLNGMHGEPPRAEKRQRRDLVIGAVLMPAFSTGVAAIYVGPFLGVVPAVIIGAIMGVAAMGLIVVTGYGRMHRLSKTPPRVLFTSVGVRFGSEERLWRQGRQRLTSVHFQEGGSHAMLRLDFQGAGPLAIPVPHDLEGAVADLAHQTLRWKTPDAQSDAMERINEKAPSLGRKE